MSDETKKNPEADETVTPQPANDDTTVEEVVEFGGSASDIAEDGLDADDGLVIDEIATDDDDSSDDNDAGRIAELEGQVADLTDRLLRAAAEMENVRKRAQKDREDASKFATSKFAEDMLAVADNLNRALEAVSGEDRQGGSAKGLVEGVDLTMRALNGALSRHGIEMIETAGARFDPNLHQAMFETETNDFEPGTVMQVLRSGYMIHGRLLRPVMVGVAKAPKEDASSEA
ncbi:MAG: nucleotide exchange factor GrpE [Rhodospirillales bacterium]|nr:nucleotide exchange factor GrpE [Rhodospirillales bacterium]